MIVLIISLAMIDLASNIFVAIKLLNLLIQNLNCLLCVSFLLINSISMLYSNGIDLAITFLFLDFHIISMAVVRSSDVGKKSLMISLDVSGVRIAVFLEFIFNPNILSSPIRSFKALRALKLSVQTTLISST